MGASIVPPIQRSRGSADTTDFRRRRRTARARVEPHDWRSRAAACVVYQLRDLDESGRVEALRLRAAQRGLQLPQETSDYLLRRMPRDLPSLLAILDHLAEASLIAQRRLTVPFIRDALEKLARTKP